MIDSVDGDGFRAVGFTQGSFEVTREQLDSASEMASLFDLAIARIERKIKERIDRRCLAMIERQQKLDEILRQREYDLSVPMKFDPIPEDFSMHLSYRWLTMEEIDCPFPHCDSKCLHFPGKCQFCDLYPELQNARILAGVNFTGENDPDKSQCPAEAARPLELINRWGGNRAQPADSTEVDQFHN